MNNFFGGNKLLDPNLILSKAQIGPDMRVADLGCGTTGYFVFPAAELVGKKGKVYAVDILKTVLETIQRRIRQENKNNIETVWSNIELFNATKIESGSLDVVLLINTLHLSNKKIEIIRESTRLLKKDCKLVIVEWTNTNLPLGPQPDERVDPSFISNGAKNLGLKKEEDFVAGQFHYGLIFTKV